MVKNRGRRRRKNSKHEEEEDEGSDGDGEHRKCDNGNSKADRRKHKNKESDLTFKERRELERKAAAEKRRQKMKCFLCGKTGHTRRECPGIPDDGRGESKYTKSNGDAGSTVLKQKGRKKQQHQQHQDNDSLLTMPPGFEPCAPNESLSNTGNANTQEPASPFVYYDTGCDEGPAVLEYLRFGRHGHGGVNLKTKAKNNHHNHTQVPKSDAIAEYDASMNNVCETTNFGGCIFRSYLPSRSSGEEWRPQEAIPFTCFQERPSLLKFVLGYRPDEEEEEEEETTTANDEIVDWMVQTANQHGDSVVGFFADLNYATSFPPPKNNNEDHPSSRNFQMRRLRNTLRAAAIVDCPVQVRISPGYKACQHSGPGTLQLLSSSGEEPNEEKDALIDGYSRAMRDLGKILLDASFVQSWKVHLSSWNGKAEHLVALSSAFKACEEGEASSHEQPYQHKLVFGFDGSVGFSKAVHLHESAFEVAPHQLVLETGGPGILPPIVAKRCGKTAFCHSGHLPFVADELAKHMSRNPRNTSSGQPDTDTEEEILPSKITAETVARWASANTKALYGFS